MNKVIYTSPHRHVDADGDECLFRIRQVSDDDCIVESSLDGNKWDASGDDRICVMICMKAFLEEKKAHEELIEATDGLIKAIDETHKEAFKKD